MTICRELGVRPSPEWILMQCVRGGLDAGGGLPFPGPATVCKEQFGGKEKTKGRKLNAKHEAVKKGIVAGARNRETKTISAEAGSKSGKAALHRCVEGMTGLEAKLHTDNANDFASAERKRPCVDRSVGQSIHGLEHTNAMMPYRALRKQDRIGILHHTSPKRRNRCSREFAGQRNTRNFCTIARMTAGTQDMVGSQLKHENFAANAGMAQ